MTLLFIILLTIALLISLYAVSRSRLKRHRKIILCVNRLCIILLVGCIFFQPTFRFTRIAPRDNRIPVLVDLSLSMQLFNADSIVQQLFPPSSASYNRKNQALPHFVFFGFGDSLRPVQRITAAPYNDRNSIFPRYFNEKQIKNSKKICLLSDGNWTNTVSRKNSIREKECYYIPLQQVSPVSFIQLEVSNTLNSIVSDTGRTLLAVVHGFASHRDTITLQCRTDSFLLCEKKVEVDSGFFTETQLLPIPAKKTGSYLLRLTAALGDTLRTKGSVLHTIAPANFSVYLYSASPSLDKRFLTLAFRRKKEWEIYQEKPLGNKKPDLLLFLSWDSKARQLMNIFPQSSAVFIGCLPCAGKQIKRVSPGRPRFTPDSKHLLRTLSPPDFPPLSACLTCTGAPYTIQRVFIANDPSAKIQKSDSNHPPILFEAQYKGNLIVAFAAEGLWRWDFWPQSITANSNVPLFTDFLIDRMQELIQYNTNKRFFVFPNISPLYETDSLSFKIALPSYLYNYSSIHIHFSLRSTDGDTLFTTQRNSAPFHLRTHSLRTPPVQQGTYRYTCTVTSEKGTIAFEDSISIVADNSEFQVLGQNTVILEELAHQIPRSALPDITSFFTETINKKQPYNELLTHAIQAGRSWFMLGLLFFLFGVEWILRRVWRLD